MVVKLRLKQKVSTSIFVLKLDLVLGFDIDLRVQVDYVIEQFRFVAATTHLIAATNYKYFRIRNIFENELKKICEIRQFRGLRVALIGRDLLMAIVSLLRPSKSCQFLLLLSERWNNFFFQLLFLLD